METVKEIAKMLNGLQYRATPDINILNKAKENGIVIVYGASDDLMEIDGAVYDEIDCYEGGTVYFTTDGLVKNNCDSDDCPYFKEQKKNAVAIEALWCEEEVYSWTYRTSIPHEIFTVIEDETQYCRGIVFKLSDVKTK